MLLLVYGTLVFCVTVVQNLLHWGEGFLLLKVIGYYYYIYIFRCIYGVWMGNRGEERWWMKEDIR
jgi:hypothetical protein